MNSRRHVLALAGLAAAAALAVTPSSRAMAGETAPFTDAAFESAQKGGRPILIEVSAPWCPICKTQKPILAKLSAEPRFKDLQIFEIDFDTAKDLLRRLNVRMQSTLIAYKGATEVGRSVGETQPEWIEGLVEKTL
ncbi:thioredoxin family protein [Methylobacterium phyllosphaerae]